MLPGQTCDQHISSFLQAGSHLRALLSRRLQTALAAQHSPAVRGELLHVCQQDLAETPKLRERCQIALTDPGPCADELLWLLEVGGGQGGGVGGL